MTADKSLTVEMLDVSADGGVLAYGVRKGGEDQIQIRFRDTKANKDLTDALTYGRYYGGAALLPDASGVYYGRQEADGPRVYFHRMGSPNETDVEVFGREYGKEDSIGVEVSEDGRYAVYTASRGWSRSDLFVQPALPGDRKAEAAPIIPIAKGEDAVFYGSPVGDALYLLTDWKAPRKRVFKVDLNRPQQKEWTEIIAQGEGVIEGMALVGGNIVLTTMENVTSRVKIYDGGGKFLRDMPLPTLGSVDGVSGRWDSPEAYYAFSSFPVPPTIYRADVKTGKQEVWERIKVAVDADKLEVRQVWYASKDGTKVPMFLVHRKGLKLDGARPTLLYGYGGFNSTEKPYFSTYAALWAEQGGVYAVANLRGGGEFGEEWHRAGMLDKKQNTFDDFIAAAEWLSANNVTNPQKLAVMGGSNGGLLVGAALTQRPGLFKAVVCSVPLLDMLRYHRFLVGAFWVPEYGSADDPKAFATLKAYSPYHNVRHGANYPAVYLQTGDADTRVAPLHARKMTALLQYASGSDAPVMLHYDTQAGHAGDKPLPKIIEERTDELTFLFQQLGIPMR